MADLEKLLLEAAGRPAGSGRDKHPHQSSKNRHQDSYPDEDSDSNSDNGHGYAGRNRSISHVPLKKRSKGKGMGDIDGDEDDSSGPGHDLDSSDDSDVGSDLYKDEDDREQLAKMTELERELILHDRAAKKDDKKLQRQMKSRLESEKKSRPGKETPGTASRGVRSSSRFTDRTPAKTNALNELKARRMKRESDSKQRVLSTVPSSTGSPMGRKRFATSSPMGSSESESQSEFLSEDDVSVGDEGMDSSDDEKDKSGIEKPTFEDILGITVKRSKLAKWFMDPFFEELMVGCFVRIGIGMRSGQNVYRLCIVQNVFTSDISRQYQLENKMTCKYLNCVWGSAYSAARWQMARVSESPPTEEEFNQWLCEVECRSGSRPTRKQVLEKKDEIEKINNYVYNAATVKQMLQEKKTILSRPLNIAAEKEKLRREMEVAQERDDQAEIERIKARLQELEASRQAREKDQKALKLAEMNRKNRAENFRMASVSKPVNTSLKAGDAGYDPFSRRWTRSRNYYVAKKEGDDSKEIPAAAKESEGDGATGADALAIRTNGNGSIAATKAALEAAAGAGKLVDTAAPVDQGTMLNMLHNFELPISLATWQKYGGAQGLGAAFLARRQQIEAAVGFHVPEDDRRHLLTLSLGDYKRRRGLL
ncbi:hypothetical protein Droror1_Dr00004009 [Drosera rotundifolia]